MKNRLYKVKFHISVETETVKDGKDFIKERLDSIMVKSDSIFCVNKLSTDRQSRSLHLLFSQLADNLNSKGFDQHVILKPGTMIDWSTESVKNKMWKPIQKRILGFESTRKLKRINDIELVYGVLDRVLIEKTTGEVSLPPFPSVETMFCED